MRFSVILGAVAAVAALFAACGEEGGGPAGAAGSGVVAGAGGSSPEPGGGRGGLDGVSGCGSVGVTPLCSPYTAGTAGAPGDAGLPDPRDAGASDASAPDGGGLVAEPCSGCLELRATVTDNDESAFFQLEYDPGVDMSAPGATLTFRVRGLSPDAQVRAAAFIFDAQYDFARGADVELSAAAGFVDLVLPLDELTSASLDKSEVVLAGLLLGYTGGIGAESAQALAVLLDSVTFAGVETPSLGFATGAEGFDRSDDIGVAATEVVHR